MISRAELNPISTDRFSEAELSRCGILRAVAAVAGLFISWIHP